MGAKNMMARTVLCLVLAFLFSSNASAVFIGDNISTSDGLATDATGQSFYYDLFNFTVDFEMEVELFVNPQEPVSLYLAYWDGDFSPTPDWFAPPPVTDDGSGIEGENLYLKLLAMPGVIYQVMVSSWEFNDSNGSPPLLGSYFSWITTPPIDGDTTNRDETGLHVEVFTPSEVHPVPAPGAIFLFGIGFVIMGYVSRLKNVQCRLNPVST